MARTITYHVIDSEAYDKGYDDGYEVGKLDAFKQMKVDDKGYQMGWKDAVDMACVAIHNMMVDGIEFSLDDNDYIMQEFRKVVGGKA